MLNWKPHHIFWRLISILWKRSRHCLRRRFFPSCFLTKSLYIFHPSSQCVLLGQLLSPDLILFINDTWWSVKFMKLLYSISSIHFFNYEYHVFSSYEAFQVHPDKSANMATVRNFEKTYINTLWIRTSGGIARERDMCIAVLNRTTPVGSLQNLASLFLWHLIITY